MSNFEIQLPAEQQELTIYQATKPTPRERQTLNIEGTIECPYRYFTRRSDDGKIQAKDCLVTIDEQDKIVTLLVDPEGQYTDKITGKLEPHPGFTMWHINTSDARDLKSLCEKIRKNKYLFADRDVAASIISKLDKLNAKVTTEIKSENDRKGKQSASIDQVVTVGGFDEETLKFRLYVPLFCGENPVHIDIEIIPEARGGHPVFMLESTELNQMVDATRERIFQQIQQDFEDKQVCVLQIK